MRLLPVVALLVAACAAAGGCATVSAPPPHRPVTPRTADASRPDRPDDLRVVQSPGHEVLGTARPDGRPAAAPAPAARRPAARAYVPPPRRHRPAAPRHRPHPPAPAYRLPGGGSVCGLGQAYGGWASDSPAARICRQAYGR